MNKIIPCIAICLTLLSTSAIADFDAGLAAYDRKDYTTALKEFSPLAKQGDPQSQHLLGNMYLYGRGITQSDSDAALWFGRSALQGNPDAQLMFGMLNNEGNVDVKGRLQELEDIPIERSVGLILVCGANS